MDMEWSSVMCGGIDHLLRRMWKDLESLESYNMVTQLMQYGLTLMEAQKFVSLLQNLEIPEQDIQEYEAEFDSNDPFCGQLSDSEALIALYQAYEMDQLIDNALNEPDDDMEELMKKHNDL